MADWVQRADLSRHTIGYGWNSFGIRTDESIMLENIFYLPSISALFIVCLCTVYESNKVTWKVILTLIPILRKSALVPKRACTYVTSQNNLSQSRNKTDVGGDDFHIFS